MVQVQSLHCRSDCSELSPEGHPCLLWRQPKKTLVYLEWRRRPLVDRYQEARATKASVVMDVKTWVWEEFKAAMDNDFWSASKRFCQTVR